MAVLSLSCRMREGGWRRPCARSPPSRRSHPPPPRLSLSPLLPPFRPPLVPATQMASRRAHFISASYSRPARRRKWKQWDTAVICYRMLVASLNSHLYYLSASKSARARRRIPSSLPLWLERAAVPLVPTSRRSVPFPPSARHRVTGCI